MGYPRGITQHGEGIQITFTWQGERHRPTWPHKPTARNIEAASRLRADIVNRSKMNILTLQYLSEYFPQYVKPEVAKSTHPLFSEMAQIYLNTTEVSPNTRNSYRQTLMQHWMPEWATTPVNEISAGDVRRVVSSIQWTSAKTRNNSIIPLRGVMALCLDDGIIDSNPVDRIKNLKHQKPEVDPFTREEADIIVSWMRENYVGTEAIIPVYFELAFWTGMRTSELLALEWSDIDFNTGLIRVSKARSQGRLNLTTKTKKIRDVLLNDRSREALMRAKPLTFMKGGPVIISAATGKCWISDKAPRVIFTRALRKLGIRHRPTYNTRHTYASMCLMAGMNPAFVSNQLGNSVQVLMSTYAKWIHGEASRVELDKLNRIAGVFRKAE